MAMANPARVVSVNDPSRSSRGAYATAWTSTSICPWSSFHFAKTSRSWSSDDTSQASTNVAPIDSARGRTRRSRSDSTDENPSVAPSSCRALAMPQAIEWSFATPKISAFLPSRSPIGRAYHRPMSDLRSTLDGVRAFVLDADGVLLSKGAPIDGAAEALVTLRRRGIPYRVVTNYSSAHR